MRLDDLPGALSQVFGGEGFRVDVDALWEEVGVVAQLAERGLVFAESGEDQRDARGLGMMGEDRAIDGPEETNGVGVFLAALVERALIPASRISLGDAGRVGFRGLVAQGVEDRLGDCLGGVDLVEDVAVALEHTEGLAGNREDLKAFGGLEDSDRRLDVEAIGRDGELAHGSLELEDAEIVVRAEDGEAVEDVVPESVVVGKGVKMREEGATLDCRVIFLERLLELLDEVFVTNGILMVLGMTAMGRLIEREARGFAAGQKFRQFGIFTDAHDLTSSGKMSFTMLLPTSGSGRVGASS